MNLNEAEFLRRLRGIQRRLHLAWMRKILPRGPDHPIHDDEWHDLVTIVGECKTDMRVLLDLAQEDPLNSITRAIGDLPELIDTIKSISILPHPPQPMHAVRMSPVSKPKQEDMKEPEEEQPEQPT